MRFLREISPVEWVIACTALLLFVQYGLLPREVFFTPDEGMRLIVSRNLQPDSPFTGIVRYESRSVDPELAFVPYFDQWFSVAPGAELQVSYPIVCSRRSSRPYTCWAAAHWHRPSRFFAAR